MLAFEAFSIADEDRERDNAEKTSAVHFLRFQLPPDMISALKAGGAHNRDRSPGLLCGDGSAAERIRLSLCGDLQA